VDLFKKHKDKIKALAHITGGGIVENLPRVLPENIKAIVKKDDIKILPVFEFMSHYVTEEEMYRTFNMGVGMVLVVDENDVDDIINETDGYVIGKLIKGKKEVELV
jgi:phosphoribosylformylglycinamidine cyclo-ligase